MWTIISENFIVLEDLIVWKQKIKVMKEKWVDMIFFFFFLSSISMFVFGVINLFIHNFFLIECM